MIKKLMFMTEISAAGLGTSALDVHAKGKKYLLKCTAKIQSRIPERKGKGIYFSKRASQ